MDYGALLQLFTQAMGKMKSDEQTAQGNNYLLENLDRLSRLQLPDLQEISAQQLGPSEAGNVHADPEAKARQMKSLAALDRIINGGGHTLEDDAAWNDFAAKQAQAASGNRKAITNAMAARGTLDSGNQLASLLSGAQSDAQASSSFSANRAAMAQKRALEAILQSGNLAGQMRNQSFNEDFTAAQARDLINRYNTDALSRAQYHNAGLPQQNFQNQLSKINGQNNASGTLATNSARQADRTDAFYGGMGVAANNAYQGMTGKGSSTGGTGNYGGESLSAPVKMDESDMGSSQQGLSSVDDGDQWYLDENGQWHQRTGNV